MKLRMRFLASFVFLPLTFVSFIINIRVSALSVVVSTSLLVLNIAEELRLLRLCWGCRWTHGIAFMLICEGVKGVKGTLVSQFAKAARGGESAL